MNVRRHVQRFLHIYVKSVLQIQSKQIKVENKVIISRRNLKERLF